MLGVPHFMDSEAFAQTIHQKAGLKLFLEPEKRTESTSTANRGPSKGRQ